MPWMPGELNLYTSTCQLLFAPFTLANSQATPTPMPRHATGHPSANLSRANAR